mmetsp:Transcript_1940/g.6338  ORF Transcript_1940/g.6338 Transcript_1940/m.6338 type:complete len:218 (+) Transcript_1940:867-1520(+)
MSNLVLTACWSAPLVITIGHRQSRVSVIGSDMHATGLKDRSLGYKSIGDSVPEVMNTLSKRSKTGAMASDASRHDSCSTGSGMFGYRSSYGSKMSAKPFSYVPTSVPKSATSDTALNSSVSTISSVFKSDVRRSWQNFNVLPSIAAVCDRCAKNAIGVSCSTCVALSRCFRYSTSRRMNATKCSALRMFPGTASRKMSAGITGFAMASSPPPRGNTP